MWLFWAQIFECKSWFTSQWKFSNLIFFNDLIIELSIYNRFLLLSVICNSFRQISVPPTGFPLVSFRISLLLNKLHYSTCRHSQVKSLIKGEHILHTYIIRHYWQMLRENLLIFPCVLFGTYLFVNFHI